MKGNTELTFAGKDISELTIPHNIDVDLNTGALVLSLPLSLTPGRSGFGPSLALQYSSSIGNSAFGIGWSLSGLSSIGVNSKQHLPEYNGNDDIVFNGTIDLVPILRKNGGNWESRIEDAPKYIIHYYRSKIDTEHIRFEKWIEKATGNIHWRARSGDGSVSIYGITSSGTSRVADPSELKHIYLWLLEAQYDRHGNAVIYEYECENKENINFQSTYEHHRIKQSNNFPQRYIKRIRYGNTKPLHADGSDPLENEWLYEVIFDYGEHSGDPALSYTPTQQWDVRIDPFSNYRPGFEVRTYRLCRRILMFHNFEQLGTQPTLVSATQLNHKQDPAGSTLESICYIGFRKDSTSGQYTERAVPPLRFTYSSPTVAQNFTRPPTKTNENLPQGLTGLRYRWLDLYGEGLPGILTETNDAWYYKPNLGGGLFGEQQKVTTKPSQTVGTYTAGDFDRDGNADLVAFLDGQAGYCRYNREASCWESFRTFPSSPRLSLADKPQWVDLNGDGLPDIVISNQDRYTWYPSKGKEGFANPIEFMKPEISGFTQVQQIGEDLDLDIFFANMTGDGLLDQVCIQNGKVEYFPQIGYGSFCGAILMENSPVFDLDSQFDPTRIRFADLDGSGTSDILYIGRGEIHYWINAGGNRFIEGGYLKDLPYIDNLSTAKILDFLGDGTPCLVWSSALPQHASNPIQYLQLTEGIKPRLLVGVDNSLGKVTSVVYSSSSKHYLRDKLSGQEWTTKLPIHTTVVDKKEVTDQIGGGHFITRYEYHDAYFDSGDRSFRGFGLVEQYDTEHIDSVASFLGESFTEPTCVRTWYHNGRSAWDELRTQQFYNGDPEHKLLPPPVIETLFDLYGETFQQAFQCLSGQVTRQEVYKIQNDGHRAPHPYYVSQSAYRIKQLQPISEKHDSCFSYYQSESTTYNYEQFPDDPRTSHNLALEIDPYGNVTAECSIAYPRRNAIPARDPAQQKYYATATTYGYFNIDEQNRYDLAVPRERRRFELAGIDPGANMLVNFDDLSSQLGTALTSALAFHQPINTAATSLQARLIEWDRSFFWSDDRSSMLDHGSVGTHALLHHEESACFTTELVDQSFAGRVDPNLLRTDGRYEYKDGYWWQRGEIYHYRLSSEFCLLHKEQRVDNGTTEYAYDSPYNVALIEVRDDLGNTIKGELDYYVVAPYRITDPNDNISEVSYDPLGVIAVSASQGTVVGTDGSAKKYGNELLNTYVKRNDENWVNVLANPERYLQKASQFIFYDLDSWQVASTPPRSVTLVREDYVHDGQGGGAASSRIQATVGYISGFGRVLQSKQHVEGGPAIKRDGLGRVIIGADGRPEESDTVERWLVSGHTVYNLKQQPIHQYEPFYSAIEDFEADVELQAFGVTTTSHYDAIGRVVLVEMPNRTFSKVETTPWEIRCYDANDTVEQSVYKVVRESLPNSDPEKKALNKAKAHADTPSIAHLDPLGRGFIRVDMYNDGSERVTKTSLDIQDNVLAIEDSRLLTAVEYKRDMIGRVLYEHSIDAGETWSLQNALDQPWHQWDGRGTHQEFEFDSLGRPLSVHVVNNTLGLNQVIERMIYGEDSSVSQAKLRNAQGRLTTHYDQAGILTIGQYDPSGAVLHSQRQILSDYYHEPDWTNPATVNREADEYKTFNQFDGLGRIRQQQLPDNTTRIIEYLLGGGINKIKISTSDGVIANKDILQQTRYNARGQRVFAILGNGIEVTYGYDPETFKMNHLQSRIPGGKTFQDLEYTYDAVGNLTHYIDNAQQPPHPSDVIQGLNVSSHCEFTYDALYQLKIATGRVHQALNQHDYRPDVPGTLKGTRHLSLNNGAAVERYTRSYEYDLTGNIKRIHHQGVTRSWTTEIWTSSTSNRSLPKKDLSGNTITNPEHYFDANGNSEYLPHLAAIKWNYRNNISQAIIIDRFQQGKPNDAEYYVYAGDGMRVRKVAERLINAATNEVEITEKISLDGCEIKRVRSGVKKSLERFTSHIGDGNNTIAILYNWTKDEGTLETDDVTQKRIHYQLQNHLGSVSIEVYENGDHSYEEYFPYGGTALIAGDNNKKIKLKDNRYSGKERDDNTGLYYFGYRYYAAWIGNWLSPDPIGPKESINLYQYVLNNPVNLVDPNGLQTVNPAEPQVTIIPVEVIPLEYRKMMTEDEIQLVCTGLLSIIPASEEQEGRPFRLVKTEEFHEWLSQYRGDINIYAVSEEELITEASEESGLGIGEMGAPEPITFEGTEITVVAPTHGTDPPSNNSEDGLTGEGGEPPGPDGTAPDGSPGSRSPENPSSSPVHSADGSNTQATTSGNGHGRSSQGSSAERETQGPAGGNTGTQTGTGKGFGSGLGSGYRGYGRPGTGSGMIPAYHDNGAVQKNGADVETTPFSTVPTPTTSFGGEPSPQQPPPSPGGVPAPLWLVVNRDDQNDSPEESLFSTRGGIGAPVRQTQGRDQVVSDGDHPDARKAGEESILQKLTRFAAYLNLEFSGGSQSGSSEGIYAGRGSLEAGVGGQILVIAVAIIQTIMIVSTLIKSIAQAGIKALLRKVTSSFRNFFLWLRDFLTKGHILRRKETGGWLLRILRFRTGGLRPSYEIFNWRAIFRFEAHPTAHWMPGWFFRPHIHLDFIPLIQKWHIPIIEPLIAAYAGTKLYDYFAGDKQSGDEE